LHSNEAPIEEPSPDKEEKIDEEMNEKLKFLNDRTAYIQNLMNNTKVTTSRGNPLELIAP
jgi:hypothetical protein